MSENEKKRTVLVADDSYTNRELLKKIFFDKFNVIEAANGVEVLEKLRLNDNISVVILDIHMTELDGFGVLDAMRDDKKLTNIPVIVNTVRDDIESQLKALDLGAVDIIIKPYKPQLVLRRVCNILARIEVTEQRIQNKALECLLHQSEIDEKTGIYTKNAFCRITKDFLLRNRDKKYVILRWDIDRFKVYNDIFGVAAGDEILAKIGKAYRQDANKNMTYGHWEADHFVACLEQEYFENYDTEEAFAKIIKSLNPNFEYVIRMGVYIIDDPTIDVALMCDRALLALKSIKGDYDKHIAFYDESMRAALLNEQTIISEMKIALEEKQFIVYIQPQYNYAQKELHGAEALVRWRHPIKGIIPPGNFIPLFEKNGFISKVDQFVWEEVCRLQRKWLDEGIPVVPISVNISRKDIYDPCLCEIILNLVKKYNIEPFLLRLEITESAYMEDPDRIIKAVETLRSAGFSVEIDDFGSGYSSLNTLKDVSVDVLKLDMKFLISSVDDARSGSILTSVIRMANWIKLSVIAEGVETKEQADYLNSVGCYHMQGYYFARPMPVEDFEKILINSKSEKK